MSAPSDRVLQVSGSLFLFDQGIRAGLAWRDAVERIDELNRELRPEFGFELKRYFPGPFGIDEPTPPESRFERTFGLFLSEEAVEKWRVQTDEQHQEGWWGCRFLARSGLGLWYASAEHSTGAGEVTIARASLRVVSEAIRLGLTQRQAYGLARSMGTGSAAADLFWERCLSEDRSVLLEEGVSPLLREYYVGAIFCAQTGLQGAVVAEFLCGAG